MISQDAFSGLMHDLGDADAPPADGRLDAIHRKIRVVRVRRAVTAAVAVIAIVAAGLVVASMRSAPSFPAEMPKSWTTDDGVEYRLVRVVALDTAHQDSATVDVPAGAPITVRYACDAPTGTTDGPPAGMLAQITIGDGSQDQGLNCSGTPNLADFDTGKLPRSGDGASLVIKALPTTFGGVTSVSPARWTVGIYTWVMPSTLRTTSTLAPMPKLAGYRLAATRTAVWPANTITFQVPPNTTWTMLMTCSDTFAGIFSSLTGSVIDNTESTTVNGKPADGTSGMHCSTRVDPNQMPGEIPSSPITTTVTVTFTLDPIYDHRRGIIQIGIYYLQ